MNLKLPADDDSNIAMSRSPRAIYEDYVGRRKGILRALTTDIDRFWSQCDPQKENLCLYAYQDGTWACDLPAEEVPPEAPEPALVRRR